VVGIGDVREQFSVYSTVSIKSSVSKSERETPRRWAFRDMAPTRFLPSIIIPLLFLYDSVHHFPMYWTHCLELSDHWHCSLNRF